MATLLRLPFAFKKKPIRPESVEICLAVENPTLVQKIVPLAWARRRLLLGLAVGILAAIAGLGLPLSVQLRGLIAWDAGSIAYLASTWWMFFVLDAGTIKRIAHEEDEDERLIFVAVLGAVGVSLAALFFVLARASRGSSLEQTLATPLAISTLLISWVLLHTLFILHYAHLYFGDYDKNGVIDGGVQFPYKGQRSYMDFIYLAMNIAVAFQMSDIKTDSQAFRNVITIHSVVSYVYNTLILALGINLISSILR
jgi:uncharacterized membrane protein